MNNPNERFAYYKTKRNTVLKCSQRQTEEIYLTFCGMEQCMAGMRVGPRVREDYHLHVILSGKGTLQAEGKTYHLHGNQAFLLKPGEETIYEADSKDPWSYCWVSFHGTQAKHYMDAAGFTEGISARDCFVDSQEFLSLTKQILECSEVTLANEIRRLGYLLEFQAKMIDSAARGDQAARRTHDYSPDVYVDHALDFIRYNYFRIKVNDIARYIGINRSYLTNIFKKKMGISPQEYLLRYRLNMGCHLLLTTSLPIQEVAQKIGYENPLTFSKMFKKAYGVSPRSYRLQGGTPGERETEPFKGFESDHMEL